MRLCTVKRCMRKIDETDNHKTCTKCREKIRKWYHLKRQKAVVLTQERLKQILHYDPETGHWHWRVKAHGGLAAGSRAGYLVTGGDNPRGRWQINIHGKPYKASRLAFLFMIGRFPDPCALHINLDTADDRWCNLKEGDESTQKRVLNRNKKSKLPLGVFYNNGSFMARCSLNGKLRYIGTYVTPEDAEHAYQSYVAAIDPNSPMLANVDDDIKKGELTHKNRKQSTYINKDTINTGEPYMALNIQFRQRLLQILPANELEELYGREHDLTSGHSKPHMIRILARHWTAEQESIVRDMVERFIGMARAEQAADDRSVANKETVVKLKSGKGD